MDVVFNSIYARACMGAGLAVLSGLRAFLPVGFLALYSRLEFPARPYWPARRSPSSRRPGYHHPASSWQSSSCCRQGAGLQHPRPDHAADEDRLGGMVFAAAMAPDGWIAMTVSGVLGLVIAGLPTTPGALCGPHPVRPTERRSHRAHQPLRGRAGAHRLRCSSCWCRSSARWWPVPPLLIYRLRRKRKRKHKGLRILKG